MLQTLNDANITFGTSNSCGIKFRIDRTQPIGSLFRTKEAKGTKSMPQSVKKRVVAGVKWVNRREAAAIVDAQAQRVLGVSGQVFISKWKAGRYRKLDSDACPGVIELALLAPLPMRASGRKNRKGSR
jgi:hypothetical protein